ncbi:MAG: ParB N-terminal domain-containing protein [Bacillota bacterium]|nr:ParB N-terminal domain-containing protein [Bacillota bacterium]
MQQITKLSIDILKVHPKNQEFFDDITGEQYEKFKKSIKEDGIITPLIVAPDMTIISGHQRFKACKDLNIKLVPVIIREDLIDEDEKLKKLLATNFGRLKNNPIKQGKVFTEYEKLCGVKQGNNQFSIGQNVRTQQQIAKELGVDARTIRRLKKLQTLSPELQELIEDGSIKYTTALNICSRLSNNEQEKLINEIGKNKIKEMTSKQIQQYILEKQQIEDKNKQLEQSFNELSEKYDKLSETKIINKSTEDMNNINKIDTNASNTIETLKSEKRDLELKIVNLVDELKGEKVVYKDNPELIAQIDLLRNQLKDKDQEINKNKEIKNKLNEQQKIISKFTGANTNLSIIASTSENSLKMMKFLEEMSKYDYIAETFNEIPIASRKEWMRGVNGIYKWAKHILEVVDIENDTSCINKNNEPIDVTYSN